MLKPSCNIIKTPHKSYYSVVIAVAKRAREITQEAEDNNEIIVEKPVDLAGTSSMRSIRSSSRTRLTANLP